MALPADAEITARKLYYMTISSLVVTQISGNRLHGQKLVGEYCTLVYFAKARPPRATSMQH